MLRIETYPGVKQIFIANEDVSHLCAIAIVHSADGVKRVELGEEASQAKAGGIAYGAYSGTVSGKILRVVTQGIVSGVILGADCLVGDRLMLASAGRLMPLNTIQPAISAYIPGGALGIVSGVFGSGHNILSGFGGGILSGFVTINTPAQFSSGLAESLNTARVLAKALASGSAGVGIPVLVGIGG